jgi:hypothetical protein
MLETRHHTLYKLDSSDMFFIDSACTLCSDSELNSNFITHLEVITFLSGCYVRTWEAQWSRAEGAEGTEGTEGMETDGRWLQLMCCVLLPLRSVFQSARQSEAESWTELTGNSRRQG